MKRCPQCEFIYEDDQSLCDMDGVLLVLDTRTLPSLHALGSVELPAATVAARAPWRHRTFPAMAALLLATVMSLVYFVSNQRSVQSAVPTVDTSIATPLFDAPAPSDSPATNTEPPPPVVNDAAVATDEEAKPEPTKAPTAPATKKASAKTPTTQNRTAEPKKEDSKAGGILKKTGRILKKPFKF